MKIKLLVIGKTDSAPLQELISEYTNRLAHYIRFDIDYVPDIRKAKHLSMAQQKEKEGEALLQRLGPTDVLIIFDEKGKEFSSIGFAQYLQGRMNAGVRQLVFAIGGPYGFSKEVYQKAFAKISLSKMTFSHQMVRLIIVEQLYRAFTILRNEPYHHK